MSRPHCGPRPSPGFKRVWPSVQHVLGDLWHTFDTIRSDLHKRRPVRPCGSAFRLSPHELCHANHKNHSGNTSHRRTACRRGLRRQPPIRQPLPHRGVDHPRSAARAVRTALRLPGPYRCCPQQNTPGRKSASIAPTRPGRMPLLRLHPLVRTVLVGRENGRGGQPPPRPRSPGSTLPSRGLHLDTRTGPEALTPSRHLRAATWGTRGPAC